MDIGSMSDPVVLGSLVELGTSLAQLAAKGTATAIAAKVTSLKKAKDADEVRNAYDEILSEVLQERAEAILIAQAYKDALERVQISDKDIVSLNETVGRLIDLFSPVEGDVEQRKAIEQLRQLISADTLRAMQLLGFNYKAAIGDPLTRLCAEKITELGKKRRGGTGKRTSGRRG